MTERAIRIKRVFCSFALAANITLVSGITNQSFAQISELTPPKFPMYDENGVDLTTTLTSFSINDVAIGSGDTGLSHAAKSPSSSFYLTSSWQDNYTGGFSESAGLSCKQTSIGSPYLVSTDTGTECFYLAGSNFVSEKAEGASLVNQGSGNYLYTNRNGTQYTISTNIKLIAVNGGQGVVTRKVTPSGNVTTMVYQSMLRNGFPVYRLRRVFNNSGFGLEYRYVSDVTSNLTPWMRPSEIIGYNYAFEFCANNENTCSLSASWPRAQYLYDDSANVKKFTVIDSAARSTVYSMDKSIDPYWRVTGVRLPTSGTTEIISYKYCPNSIECRTFSGTTLDGITDKDMVYSSTKNGVSWKYGLTFGIGGGGYESRLFIDPKSNQTQILKNNAGLLVYIIDQKTGDRFNFSQTVRNQLVSIVRSESNSTELYYDSRGNLTQTRQVPKPNSAAFTINMNSEFPASCSSAVVCNKPLWVEDPNGNRTSFSYDAVTGLVTAEISPAVGADVLEKRYTYVQKYARVLNSSGTYTNASDPVWLPFEVRLCTKGSSGASGCATPGTEVITRYEYGSGTGADNLLVKAIVQDAGGLAARTCFYYDKFGNKTGETSPKANLSACP